MSNYVSKWHKELELFYRFKPLLILEGNIHDLFQYPGDRRANTMAAYLNIFLKDKGYDVVVRYDSVHGFRPVLPREQDELKRFAQIAGAQTEISGGNLAVDFAWGEETACQLIERAMANSEVSVAVIMDKASRYIVSTAQMEQQQTDAFTRLVMASEASVELWSGNTLNRNCVFVLVDKVNDLPVWVYKDNPHARILEITTPTREERLEFITGDNFKEFFADEVYEKEIGEYRQNPTELKKLQEKFVGLTDGFTRRELWDLNTLSFKEKCSIRELTKLVELYRYGVKENPWTDERLRDQLRKGKEVLQNRVKGQPVATERVLQVIKRAVSGLSGLQHSAYGKPKGILFFAGPTGTGKTEMAKSLAELIFGDERSCIRFDMSEYSDASSDQRLLGAPPGYVGYEAGGQLTNAVRAHPFSILLFDEIEKAHSSIMDKFLQILEDGRMTDGQGNTTYFSECVIIFTSNLGIYGTDPVTKQKKLLVSAEEKYEDVERKVKAGIGNYFKLQLGRPEILNRLGENIVVFDFIRPDAGRQIMKAQLDKIIHSLKLQQNIELVISGEVQEKLFQKIYANLDNGGRGVGNIIEEMLLNPLAEYMLDENQLQDARIVLEDLDCESMPTRLEITR